MNNKKSKRPVIIFFLGLMLFVAGVIMLYISISMESHVFIRVLTFILLILGMTLFSGAGDSATNYFLSQKNPEIAKQFEIENKDERSITIMDKARAKTFLYAYKILTTSVILFAIMQVDTTVIYVLVFDMLFIAFLFFYLWNKYKKEM